MDVELSEVAVGCRVAWMWNVFFGGNGNGIAVSAAFSRRWHAGVYDAGCVGKDWREGRIGAREG